MKDYCENQYSVMLAEHKESKRIVKREPELAAAYIGVPDLLRSIVRWYTISIGKVLMH